MTIYEKMNNVVNPYYDRIIKNKLLHIDGFGYFVIQDYEEEYRYQKEQSQKTGFSYALLAAITSAIILKVLDSILSHI